MSKIEMVAVEPVNNFKPGERFEVSEREGAQLESKGLAKMVAPPQNKMAPAPENKANPSPAAGEGKSSSASPAAPASPGTTAKQSGRGGRRRKDAASS